MLPQFLPIMALTPLLAFGCQKESAERLVPLSTVGLLPTSSFVTAIRQQTTTTTGIQPAEVSLLALASSSSLPTLPSSSPLAALFSPSLPPWVDDHKDKDKDKDKAKAKEVVVAEKRPTTTTQEVALLPRSGLRPRPPGIFAQCTFFYSVSFFPPFLLPAPLHFPPFSPPTWSLHLFFF